MKVICILAVIGYFLILWARIEYQRRCIEDFETRIERMRRLQVSEILDLLYKFQEIQSNYKEKASRDTIMRNAINENIEKYAQIKRTITSDQTDR